MHNKLQLNEDKTELMLFSNLSQLAQLPPCPTIAQSEVTFTDSVRNLGVIVDKNLSMKGHVSKVCQLCYLELRRIGSVRRYLSPEATKTLVTSFVLSRIDYCNSLLVGLPNSLLQQLQKIQNSAARLICHVPARENITPALYSLHWLPVSLRIQYKIATICFHIINNTAPPYLCDLLQLYSPSRELRSAADNRIFRIPSTHKKTKGDRAFSYAGPVIWNNLPFSVRHAEDSVSFKAQLKTYLFSTHFDT